MNTIGCIITPVDFGGSERVNLNFLESIDRRLFNVVPILLMRPWETNNYFVKRLEDLNYSFHTIPVAKKPLKQGHDYLRVMRCFILLIKILCENRVHIVHTHGYFADIIGIPASKILRIPCISTCHGFISTGKILSFYNKIDKFFLRFCNSLITVSNAIAEELVRNGISVKRINIVPNAVPRQFGKEEYKYNRIIMRRKYNLPDSVCVIGFIGRMSIEKGIDILFQAFKLLNLNGKDYRLLLIGKGPLKIKLQELVEVTKLTEKVIFAGFQEDVYKWLPMIDIFALPSLTEGTPMALLEAMSARTTVVASSVGGVPQIIKQEENGILVTPGSVDELLNAITRLCKDKKLRKKLAKNAMKTAKSEYGVDVWIKNISDIYVKTINRQHKRVDE